MTDYSLLTDEIINAKVAVVLGFDMPAFIDAVLAREEFEGERFDPCNSWADAGPIAQEMKIAIYPRKDGSWMAQGFENCIAVIDGDPCRAICIVFLMMNEGE